jgi:ABC-type multidrug transport system ATPase subunit
VILSTHIVEDVRELCRSMAIINKGEVLLAGSPEAVIGEVQGKIWRITVEKSELECYNRDFSVISTRLVAGKPVIHVFSETQPEEGFVNVEADLEDVYFHRIAGAQSLAA